MLTVITGAARWAAARDEARYRPEELDLLGYVRCCTDEEVARGFESLHPLRVVLTIDPSALTTPVEPGSSPRILGPIDKGAVVSVAPLRPRTPDGHTLYGVLTRLHLGDRSDPELVRQLDSAFAREIGLVRSWVRSELRAFSEAQAEELVQDVLAEAWAKLPNYVPNARFRAYLKQIALNKCSTVRRKKRDALTEDGELDPECEQPDALDRLEAVERDRMVEEAAAAVLNSVEQEIVQLRYVHDYPLDEIVTRLTRTGAGVPVDANGVRVALQRIRRRLLAEIGRRLAPE